MTTVAVDAATHQRLHHLKESWGLDSYNEVIGRLLDKASGTPKSMFGIDKDDPVGPLDRKTRNEMWGD
jgi:predicted CopG family antitoxin